jgi:ribosomal protein L7/L12
MKVFISWSGKQSQMLAQALRDWLPLVLHYVQPWLSGADIEAGKRWSVEIAKQLEESNFGIICLTRENVESSWVLFEAGALAKNLQNSLVIPLLLNLDIRDVSGPLSQFQAKKINKTSIFEIVQTINQASESPVEAARLTQLFEALWPQLKSRLDTIPPQVGKSGPVRSQQEILEELVTTIRGIDQRLSNLEQALPNAVSATIPEAKETIPLDEKIERRARSLASRGEFIQAIKLVRQATNHSLKESKDIVMSWDESRNSLNSASE